MEEVLFLQLVRAVAMGGGPFSPPPRSNSLAVPVEKPVTARTVARQRASQETKYPNLSLLPSSDLLPLAKPQPEARGPRNLGDEALRGQPCPPGRHRSGDRRAEKGMWGGVQMGKSQQTG